MEARKRLMMAEGWRELDKAPRKAMPEMLRTLVGDKYFETLVAGAFVDGEGYHGLTVRAPEKARLVLLRLSGVDAA
eukprot:6658307-Alexandrium_andersonii.AAC.1